MKRAGLVTQETAQNKIDLMELLKWGEHMQDWKFRYNILKENCDDIVRKRVNESSIAFTKHLTNELERHGIKVEFKKSEMQTSIYGHCLEISNLDCTALEKPLKDKIELLQKELEQVLNEKDVRCKQVSELTEKLERIENTQPESKTSLTVPGTTIDVARMIIQGKTINGEQYNIYGIKEIAEYLMVHCKNYNIKG